MNSGNFYMNILRKDQNKILGLAKNYLKQYIEKGGKDLPTHPLIFEKPWSSILFEPNNIKTKIKENRIVDHEIELAFILSKKAHKIKKENYLDYIGGYFLCLDLTDRNFLQESLKNGWPWFYSKGSDNFLPLSNFIEKSEVKDPHNLNIELRINNEIRQSDNTGNMYFKIGETLEHLTKYVTLNEGDLILTGTPAGIGQINVGDKLKGVLKQDEKVLVEMNYLVEEEQD